MPQHRAYGAALAGRFDHDEPDRRSIPAGQSPDLHDAAY
jgi:hypothetical protein